MVYGKHACSETAYYEWKLLRGDSKLGKITLLCRITTLASCIYGYFPSRWFRAQYSRYC